MIRNYHIWAGVCRNASRIRGFDVDDWDWRNNMIPTVVIDVDLASWALPFAVHAGGPLLGKPGFHFRIGPVNIGWSRL